MVASNPPPSAKTFFGAFPAEESARNRLINARTAGGEGKRPSWEASVNG